jgi:glutathione synthase/RimK-type ligase-like ATP-grasp enzyme
VLTVPIDPTADMVLTHLRADGVPFLRVDPADFPTTMGLRAELTKGVWVTDLGAVRLDDVRSVYYRRPGRFAFDPCIPTEMLLWCEGQARFGFWGVLESLPAQWINDPALVLRAEYKPYQLAQAAASDLDVPRSLVTNEPDAVGEFADGCPNGVITKALYARTPRTVDGEPTGAIYTEFVPPSRYADREIATTAHLFQERLVKIHDVRVTVVDDTVFATEIHNPGELDWRRSHHGAIYRDHRLPAEVLRGVRRLMDGLGLRFGALDFVLTERGYVFIEINPNGQWGWIENRTGQPISRALADALAAPVSAPRTRHDR